MCVCVCVCVCMCVCVFVCVYVVSVCHCVCTWKQYAFFFQWDIANRSNLHGISVLFPNTIS